MLIGNAAMLVAAGAGAAAGLLTYTVCGRLPAWLVRHAMLAYANAIGGPLTFRSSATGCTPRS
jgi:hypothetical protein